MEVLRWAGSAVPPWVCLVGTDPQDGLVLGQAVGLPRSACGCPLPAGATCWSGCPRGLWAASLGAEPVPLALPCWEPAAGQVRRWLPSHPIVMAPWL